jgi:phage baseplate assembly protein V
MKIETLLRRLESRLNGMIARAVVATVNDALKTQRIQLTIRGDNEVANAEHFQPYGLSFVPPSGSEAVALAVAGARSHTVAICAQHPDKRPKGSDEKTGGLYTEGEWRLFIDADGIVHIGQEVGAAFIPRDDLVQQQFVALKNAINAAVPVANDGGANLKTTLLAALASWPSSTAATKGKVT